MSRWMMAGLLAAVLLAVGTAGGATLVLHPTRDTKITGHRQEVEYNSGRAARLRTVAIQRGSAEFTVLDFDAEALAGFLKQQDGKEISAKLVLTVRQVQGPKAKIEVCALDSANDWKEGRGSLSKAEKGEATALMAQHGVKKWATADGAEVGRFKELIYDKATEKVKTLLNSQSVEVDKQDRLKKVEIELDDKLLAHLAGEEKCRGLVLFHRSPGTKADFFSREQAQHKPRLVVTAK
ncbi:MAG: hypothetical protein ACOC8E_05615 [Planctomycetota bacterium]